MGEKSKVNKQVLFEFKIQEVEIGHPFLVIKKLTNPIILGFDFIDKYEGIIIPQSKKFVIEKLIIEAPLINELQLFSMSHELVNNQKSEQDSIMDEFQDVFRPETGKIINYKHEIKMKTREPFKAKLYPIPEAYKPDIRKQIQELVKQGVIKVAPTQYINPLLISKKKNGD